MNTSQVESRTILVTGGAGYIGSHVCQLLAASGYTPVTFDSLERGHRWAVQWGPLEIGDIADGARLDQVFRAYRPAAVMHFAAYAYVGESVHEPLRYYRNNIGGTVSLLEAAVRAGAPPIVFSSSCATYGASEVQPITEEHPQEPINPYGRSKLTVERILAETEAVGGSRHAVLRYFNAAGADPSGRIGEVHTPETHLIPLAFHAATGKTGPLTILGDDYPTPDGTCVRDYIHVCDIADAHLRALAALLGGAPSLSINLGNGRGASVREVISAVERVTGMTVPVAIGARRPGDPPILIADARKAWDVLGWRPERPDIATQITDAWHWENVQPPTDRD